MLGKGHDKSADAWALGIFIYELYMGKTPFADPNQNRTIKKILHSGKYLKFVPSFDPAAKELICLLLNPNPHLRLGNLKHEDQDIMDHSWWKKTGFDFKALNAKTVRSPYQPPISDKLDTSNFDEVSQY